MPYSSNQTLPPAVRAHLPSHGQDIYRAAFNNAWEEWHDEVRAHRIAWSAVTRRYVKDDGEWFPKGLS